MELLLLISLATCLLAACWALTLAWRMRDWGIGGLGALILLMGAWRAVLVARTAWWGGSPFAEYWTDAPFMPALAAAVTGFLSIVAVWLLARTLTGRSRLGEQLGRREREAEMLAENVPDIVARFDRGLRHIYVNRQVERVTGLPATRFVGRTNRELGMPPELVELWERRLNEVFAGGQPRTFDFEFPAAEGLRQFEARLFPEFAEDGSVETVLNISRDVTDIRQATKALRESERKFRAVVDEMPVLLDAFDEQGRILAWNRECERITGHRASDVIGSDKVLDLLYPDPDSRRALLAEWKRRGKDFRDWEVDLTTRDGQTRTIAWSNITQRVPIAGWAHWAVGVDVTQRKRVEAELRAANLMLQSVFDASPLAVVILDQAGCVTSWNPAAERLFGWTAAEVLGQPYPAVPDVELANFQAVLRAGMGGKRTIGMELTRRRKDGSLVTVQLWTAPVQDADGNIVASLGLFSDMTERRRAETQLRDAEERLAHAARLKTMGEMVAGIAHEINQPLYAIGNYANACSNAVTLDVEMAITRLPYWTRQINDQVTRAGEIIRRLRGFAQKSPGQRGAVPLNHLIRESLALLSGDLRRHVVRSRLDLQEPDLVILADRVQIQQVLVNLVRNACEALAERPEAERLLIVRTRASGEWAVTAVEDRGNGLPPDDSQRVFEPFFTTKPDGLGMGLAISHSIIEAHGGRFTAAPAEPQGAVFEFWLPLSN